MEISVTDFDGGMAVDTEDLVALAEAALRLEEASGVAELSLALVSTQRMAELNGEYLGRSGPTDVLAFPMDSEPGDETVILGDVVLCPGVIKERSEDYGVAAGDELGYALVHGILHLLGWEHDDEDANERMDEEVRRILNAHAEGNR